MATISAGGNLSAGRDILVNEVHGNGSSITTSVVKEEEILKLVDQIKTLLFKNGEGDTGEMLGLMVKQAIDGQKNPENPYLAGLRGVVRMVVALREDIKPLTDQLLSFFLPTSTK